MNIFKALIIGIIQGITEWLPISSEGIISLIMINFFGSTFKEAVILAIWLHIGTLLAAIVFFRKELVKILQNLKTCLSGSRRSSKICTLIGFLSVSTFLTALIGTPILLLGLDKIDIPGQIATIVISLLLVITGGFQLLARRREKPNCNVELKAALPVGAAQGFAVLPGISRSGITISILLLLGYDSRNALRLSFLMSIPVIIGVELSLILIGEIALGLSTLVAAGASFLAGIATIKIFITAAEKIDFGYFCIFIGVLGCLALLI